MMTAAAARVPASATRPTAFRRSTQSKHAHPPVALSSKHRRLTSVIVRAEAATEEAPSAGADGETYEYQAEVNRLLDLIVNSLYSNRDVFLRELVSNASDALDKLRFTAVSNQDVMAANGEMKMQIKGDPVAKTLVIEDTGIGMTREDLVSSLGTIGEPTFLSLRNHNYFNPPVRATSLTYFRVCCVTARSGTAKFMEMLQSQSEKGDNLIGKFGVGFYSAFLVASRITVVTKNADDDKAWVWESEIDSSSYSIREATDADGPPARGTKIVLSLKEGAEEFAEGEKLTSLVKTYSEFISFPIEVFATKSVPKQVEDAEATASATVSLFSFMYGQLV